MDEILEMKVLNGLAINGRLRQGRVPGQPFEPLPAATAADGDRSMHVIPRDACRKRSPGERRAAVPVNNRGGMWRDFWRISQYEPARFERHWAGQLQCPEDRLKYAWQCSQEIHVRGDRVGPQVANVGPVATGSEQTHFTC